MRRTIGALAVLLAMALVFGPGAASAGKAKRVGAKVTMAVTSDNGQPAPDFFGGKVRSKRPSCKRAGRKVMLVQNGVVKDTSTLNGEGKFQLTVLNPHSNVFLFKAKLKKTKRCKAAASPGVFAD